MKSQEFRNKYLLEVAETCRHKAEALDERLKNAERMGAQDKDSVWHGTYLELIKEANEWWEKHDNYMKQIQYEDLSEKAKEIFV